MYPANAPQQTAQTAHDRSTDLQRPLRHHPWIRTPTVALIRFLDTALCLAQLGSATLLKCISFVKLTQYFTTATRRQRTQDAAAECHLVRRGGASPWPGVRSRIARWWLSQNVPGQRRAW